MRVLVTGGLGNVGSRAVRALLAMGYEVVIFEHPSARQKRTRQSRALLGSAKGKLTIFYGDVSDAATMSALGDSLQSKDVRAVLHLAGIIPPLATRAPELAQRINVEGTQNVIALCKHLPKPPRIVFASSIALYGDRLANPWISAQDPLCPNDVYALTKQQCEAMLQKGDLPWTILRLSYVVASDWLPLDPLLFEVPLATHFEVVHTEDAGRAFATAWSTLATEGRILNIGGGILCRTTYRAYLDRMMRAFGLGDSSFLSDDLFATRNFHCGWLADSDEAELLLNFRSKTLEDYYSEVAWRERVITPLAKAGAPFAKRWLRSLSPYRAKPGLAHLERSVLEKP